MRLLHKYNKQPSRKSQPLKHKVISKGFKYLTNIKCGRSFEEAFIIDNVRFIFEKESVLSSIKNKLKQYTYEDEIFNDSYEIADFIGRNNKKTDFAFDLLITQKHWQIPTYIKEGLLWLAQ